MNNNNTPRRGSNASPQWDEEDLDCTTAFEEFVKRELAKRKTNEDKKKGSVKRIMDNFDQTMERPQMNCFSSQCQRSMSRVFIPPPPAPMNNGISNEDREKNENRMEKKFRNFDDRLMNPMRKEYRPNLLNSFGAYDSNFQRNENFRESTQICAGVGSGRYGEVIRNDKELAFHMNNFKRINGAFNYQHILRKQQPPIEFSQYYANCLIDACFSIENQISSRLCCGAMSRKVTKASKVYITISNNVFFILFKSLCMDQKPNRVSHVLQKIRYGNGFMHSRVTSVFWNGVKTLRLPTLINKFWWFRETLDFKGSVTRFTVCSLSFEYVWRLNKMFIMFDYSAEQWNGDSWIDV